MHGKKMEEEDAERITVMRLCGTKLLDCEPCGAEVIFAVPRQEGYRKSQG